MAGSLFGLDLPILDPLIDAVVGEMTASQLPGRANGGPADAYTGTSVGLRLALELAFRDTAEEICLIKPKSYLQSDFEFQ
jgi:hypothetical protein